MIMTELHFMNQISLIKCIIIIIKCCLKLSVAPPLVFCIFYIYHSELKSVDSYNICLSNLAPGHFFGLFSSTKITIMTLTCHLSCHLGHILVLSVVTVGSRLVGGTAGSPAIGHAKRVFPAAVSLVFLAFLFF